MIYTAGPDLTGNEEKYVVDSIREWRNGNFDGYIKRFEKALCNYTGAEYAKTTNSGTGALHLACMACGLEAGDEVITSELSYIASANAIEYTGAKPVFCDVDPVSWCIDADKIEDLITPKTKAIMPVYLYGNMPDMGKIMDIARKYGLYVIADACPALGASQKLGKKWRKAGSIADISCFSFQGAKVAVTGEGGALLSSDARLMDRVRFYNNNCEVEGRKFYHNGVGHCYDMSNVCAAMGLAQLERIDDFIDKKRKIRDWYELYGLKVCKERDGTKSGFWMTSFIPDCSREEIMRKLKARDVDTRPVFYPISSFNHYETQDSPVSSRIGNNAINLPSGVMLTEETVKHVAEVVTEVNKSNCQTA